MAEDRRDSVTDLLRGLATAGDDAEERRDRLYRLIYDDLHDVAAALMRVERPGHTLQPTALVHEAYLRLVHDGRTWEERSHFLGIATRVMRQVLVDHARARGRAKRGGDWQRITLEEGLGAGSTPGPDVDVLAMHEALDKLAALSERQARIVEMRFFGGLTMQEIADVLELGTTTVENNWATARAWLHRELSAT